MRVFEINQDFSIDTHVRGELILQDPILNKGTAFTEEERTRLRLHGLLPPHIKTLEEQVDHCYSEYQQKETDLAKHIYLRGLQDRNEVLFYALLRKHIAEMLEIVYT
ncbi:MAG: NAD-dependent malic enzyme, partial [Chlamydiae bacterium]|nr:NAD-dependent malic enzyme [Chlamydiota bacterium]